MVLRILPAILLMTLVVACSSATTSQPTTAPKAAAQPTAVTKAAEQPKSPAGGQTYVFGGGPTGGVFAIIGAGFASLLEKAVPGVRTTAQATSGSTENVRLMGKGDIQFAPLSADVAYYGSRGEREFERDGKKYENMRHILRGYASPLIFMAPKDSGIKSVADFKGKKLGVLTGVTAESWFPLIYPLYGLSKGDFQQVILGSGEIASAMKDKNVDAIVYWGGLPTSSITDLAMARDLVYFSVDKEKLTKLLGEHSYWSDFTIPKGAYRGIEEPFPTIGAPIFFGAAASVPDDIVYALIKALDENKANLKQIHPLAAEYVVETGLLNRTVPLHPGAEKYYKEKGLLK